MRLTRRELRHLINETFDISFRKGTTQQQQDAMINQLDDLLDLTRSQYYTKFTNELDNEIELAIEPYDSGPAGQLTITMRGPNSESTNTITREEAVQLNEMLTRYLIEETSRDPNDLGLEKKYKPGDYEVLDYDSDDNQIPDHMEKF